MTQAPAPRPEPRLQFSLASMLVFLAVSALLLGVCQGSGVGMELAVFGIGFYGFMMLLLGLIGLQRRRHVTVYEAKSEVEARLCGTYLQGQGIPGVRVEGQDSAFPNSWPVVVVPAEHALRALELLAAHAAFRRA